jgi:hypothetical protein
MLAMNFMTAVILSVAAATPTPAPGGVESALRRRVLNANDIPGYTAVLSHEPLRTVGDFDEEVASLCVKVESRHRLSHAGFVSGYEESLGDRSPATGGVAFSIVSRFASAMRAETFLQRDHRLCGSPTMRQRYRAGVAKLKVMGIPGSVGYRLSASGKQTYYLVMFASGSYIYTEALMSRTPAGRRFTSGVDALYERVRGR